jgi:hypothetical protein
MTSNPACPRIGSLLFACTALPALLGAQQETRANIHPNAPCALFVRDRDLIYLEVIPPRAPKDAWVMIGMRPLTDTSRTLQIHEPELSVSEPHVPTWQQRFGAYAIALWSDTLFVITAGSIELSERTANRLRGRYRLSGRLVSSDSGRPLSMEGRFDARPDMVPKPQGSRVGRVNGHANKTLRERCRIAPPSER